MYDENSGNSPSNDGFSPEIPVQRGASSSSTSKRPAQKLNCPYCRKSFLREETSSMPFCSSRCKQIDLGMWLNENHSIPYEVDPEGYRELDID